VSGSVSRKISYPAAARQLGVVVDQAGLLDMIKVGQPAVTIQQ
jgi:hypothetical protein